MAILKDENMVHKLLSYVNNSNKSLKGMRDFFFVNTVDESLLMNTTLKGQPEAKQIKFLGLIGPQECPKNIFFFT